MTSPAHRTDRVVIIYGPVSPKLDLLLRQEGLGTVAASAGPTRYEAVSGTGAKNRGAP